MNPEITSAVPPQENANTLPLDDIELENRKRKGGFFFTLFVVMQVLLILCELFYGPAILTVAIITLGVLSFICWVAALFFSNELPRRTKIFSYAFVALLIIDICIPVFVPTRIGRIVTVNPDGWETHYAIKSYESEVVDGKTFSIPVEFGKIYLENNTSVTLESYDVYYNGGKLKEGKYKTVLIPSGEIQEIHSMPRFMFQDPPSTLITHNRENNLPPSGYFGVVHVAK